MLLEDGLYVQVSLYLHIAPSVLGRSLRQVIVVEHLFQVIFGQDSGRYIRLAGTKKEYTEDATHPATCGTQSDRGQYPVHTFQIKVAESLPPHRER